MMTYECTLIISYQAAYNDLKNKGNPNLLNEVVYMSVTYKLLVVHSNKPQTTGLVVNARSE